MGDAAPAVAATRYGVEDVAFEVEHLPCREARPPWRSMVGFPFARANDAGTTAVGASASRTTSGRARTAAASASTLSSTPAAATVSGSRWRATASVTWARDQVERSSVSSPTTSLAIASMSSTSTLSRPATWPTTAPSQPSAPSLALEASASHRATRVTSATPVWSFAGRVM